MYLKSYPFVSTIAKVEQEKKMKSSLPTAPSGTHIPRLNRPLSANLPRPVISSKGLLTVSFDDSMKENVTINNSINGSFASRLDEALACSSSTIPSSMMTNQSNRDELSEYHQIERMNIAEKNDELKKSLVMFDLIQTLIETVIMDSTKACKLDIVKLIKENLDFANETKQNELFQSLANTRPKPKQVIVGYPKEYLKTETERMANIFKQEFNKLSGLFDECVKLEREKESESTSILLKYNELQRLLNGLKDRIKDQEASVKDALEQSEKLKKAQSQLAELRKLLVSRDSQIEKVKDEIEKQKLTIKSEYERKISEYEIELLKEKNKCKQLEENESFYRTSYETVKTQYDDMKNELITSQRSMDELKVQLDGHIRERDRLASQIQVSENNLQRALENQSQNEKYAQQRIDALNQEKQKVEELLSQSRLKVDDISKKFAAATRRETELEHRAEQAEKLVDTLSKQLKESSEKYNGESQKTFSELADYRSKSDLLNQSVQMLTKERDFLQARDRELIEKLAIETERNASASIKLKSIETANELEARKAAFEITEQRRRIQELEKEVNEKVNENKQLETQSQQLKAIKESNEMKIISLEADLVSTKEALLQTGSSNEERIVQVQDLKKENEQLKRELSLVNGAKRNAVELEMKIREFEDILHKSDKERRELHNKLQEMQGNIRVVARIRPSSKPSNSLLNQQQQHVSCSADGMGLTMLVPAAQGIKSQMSFQQQQLSSSSSTQPHSFSFNRVFSPVTTQEEVFEEVSLFVQSALDGYNVCLFSYGQTGSGKTYTMTGRQDDPKQKGIIPRAVDKIFEYAIELRVKGWQFEMQASFLEIYNENVNDLLLTNPSQKKKLDVRQMDGNVSNVCVPGLTQVPIANSHQLHQLLALADKNRSVAATDANEYSSRSHSVFSVSLKGKHNERGISIEGNLSMCDLAGSEKLVKSKAEGDRLTEAKSINKSLSSLKSVFVALANKSPHIPFRDSKLTHLLSPCFSGNGKVLMIVNLSPDYSDLQESLTTLRFAKQVNCTEIGKAKKTVGTLADAGNDDMDNDMDD